MEKQMSRSINERAALRDQDVDMSTLSYKVSQGTRNSTNVAQSLDMQGGRFSTANQTFCHKTREGRNQRRYMTSSGNAPVSNTR